MKGSQDMIPAEVLVLCLNRQRNGQIQLLGGRIHELLNG